MSFNQPQINTFLKGDKENAKRHLPVAFKLYEDYMRRAAGADGRLEQDKFSRAIDGVSYEIKMHHGQTSITVMAPPGLAEEQERGERRKARRQWIEEEKADGQELYYRIYVHLDLLTRTHYDGVYAGDEILRSDIDNWLVTAEWKGGLILDIQSASIPLMNLGGGAANSPTWDGVYDPVAQTSVEEIIAYYEGQQPSSTYGPGVIAGTLADSVFFAPYSDPQTSGGTPWTSPLSPWFLTSEYRFGGTPPGSASDNAGTCNDPIYHEIQGNPAYAEWHKADSARVTRYSDGVYGCNTAYTYDYIFDHPTNHKTTTTGYYSRIYGQRLNGTWHSHNSTTYTNSMYAFGMPLSRAFVTSQSLNIAGQRYPIIQHHQWNNLDQTTDYGFIPGWVDSEGLCFYGEFIQWNQTLGDESAGYDALNMTNLKCSVGYGLDPFSSADMRGAQTASTTGLFKLLVEQAIEDAGGTLYDPMTYLDSRHLDNQFEFWGHTAVDIRDDAGTICSTPIYNLKIYMIPMITQWSTRDKTYHSEEYDV